MSATRFVRANLAGAIVLSTALLGAAGCGSTPVGPSAAGSASSGASVTTTTTFHGATAAVTTYPTVTVTDAAGSSLQLTAQAVTSSPTISVGGALRSAAPGQVYLVEQLSVSVSGRLADVDDPDTGLSPDIELGLDPTTAAAHGYSAVCGVEPGDPSSLCPIALGQGLVVDSLSAPGCGASGGGSNACIPQILVVSYGPVPASFPVSAVSVWFHAPPRPPQKLST